MNRADETSMPTDEAAHDRPAWRPMTEVDLSEVDAIATVVHRAFPESPAVAAERLRLYPAGCRVLSGKAGVIGYLVSHPWRLLDPPKLNSALGRLPADPDTYYVHDLGLLPAARGGGAGSAAVGLAIGQATAAGLKTLSLVAVSGSGPFWAHNGFRVHTDDEIRMWLKSYGSDARFMVRPVP